MRKLIGFGILAAALMLVAPGCDKKADAGKQDKTAEPAKKDDGAKKRRPIVDLKRSGANLLAKVPPNPQRLSSGAANVACDLAPSSNVITTRRSGMGARSPLCLDAVGFIVLSLSRAHGLSHNLF